MILGPKLPKSAFWDSKITFWGPFRSLAQKAYETKGLGAPFSHFWTQNAKMGSFIHFWATKCKKESFCTFGAKSAKMSSFSVFGSQSAQKGSSNHLFHKPFGPGRKMNAKMRFRAQNAFLGTKMLPGKGVSRCIHTFPHRCSEIRRVKNTIL